jgi:hypothetical protein
MRSIYTWASVAAAACVIILHVSMQPKRNMAFKNNVVREI